MPSHPDSRSRLVPDGASPSRREFLSSLGTLSAAGMLAEPTWLDGATRGAIDREPAGLAIHPGDFAFARGLSYLQTGSLGPTPRPVIERSMAAWRKLELNPTLYGYGELEHAMDDVRAKAARLLGCKTEEMVLTTCTTAGMNWVAQGLTLTAGDHVLTTDQEHPGGRACWDYVARRYGVTLDLVEIPAGENSSQAIIDRFARAITPRTRVLSFSHLLSSTGLRMPVAELSALGRSRGCLVVVDGAQAVGGVSVDVKALGCHAYATSGHKWLLGPAGTGLLYLSEELGRSIDPIPLEAGRSAYSNSSGVCSIPSVMGLDAAIDYVSDLGINTIERYNLSLGAHLHAALQGVPQVHVVSAAPGPLASPNLTFRLPDAVKSGNLGTTLRTKHNMQVKVVPANWLNGLRISTHLFNTEQQVDRLVAALRHELG
jgi:selenocysteine lyase/cysteine desulfurase